MGSDRAGPNVYRPLRPHRLRQAGSASDAV